MEYNLKRKLLFALHCIKRAEYEITGIINNEMKMNIDEMSREELFADEITFLEYILSSNCDTEGLNANDSELFVIMRDRSERIKDMVDIILKNNKQEENK
jgi:hypothetical protein